MTTNPSSLTVKCKVHFKSTTHGRKRMATGEAPTELSLPRGRVPRIARFLALAIRSEELIRSGEITDYAELAHLGRVTRARITQLMNLLNLAPDIQEQILFLPLTASGRDPIAEHQVRPIAAQPLWGKQRKLWSRLLSE